MTEKTFMKKAVEKARLGIRRGQTPFGACVVKNGRIVSCAHNGVWASCDITAHAEIRAIRTACKKLKSVHLRGCTLYSTCEPCPMCFSACHWAQLDKIVFGSSIPDAQNIGFNELALSNRTMKRLGKSAVKIRSGFLRNNCLDVFRTWQTQGTRKTY